MLRRTFLPALAAPLLPAAAGLLNPANRVYFGTYTRNGSKGIYTASFDNDSGSIGELTLAAELPNPSFLTEHPSLNVMYAVTEGDSGSVVALAMEKDGRLRKLNELPSEGGAPCHVSVNRNGRVLAIANYTGGNCLSYLLNKDGSLQKRVSNIAHKGIGANAARQDKAHAHSVNFSKDGRYLVVADLGIDQLLVYKVDGKTGELTPAATPYAEAKPGAGPRHFSFHPLGLLAFSINELDSTLSSWRWNPLNGKLSPADTKSTLPADFKESNTTAEVLVHPNGGFVYGSNRGHDSLAIYRLNLLTGGLSLVNHTSTGGKTPRNFRIDPTGRYLWAANMNSDNAVGFKVNGLTGELTPLNQKVSVGAPVCIRFVKL
jgi:6-phosphogluconolactonase